MDRKGRAHGCLFFLTQHYASGKWTEQEAPQLGDLDEMELGLTVTFAVPGLRAAPPSRWHTLSLLLGEWMALCSLFPCSPALHRSPSLDCPARWWATAKSMAGEGYRIIVRETIQPKTCECRESCTPGGHTG